LGNHAAAENAIQKASMLAPLDLTILIALTYAQYLNQDYKSAITTSVRVHDRKNHEKAAMVHYFAAASWQMQNNLDETQDELQTFRKEEPKCPKADAARHMIEQIDDRRLHPAQ